MILASGNAKEHKGIRIITDGNGIAGQLNIALIRDSHSLNEVSCTKTVNYTEGETVIDIPWGDFKNLWPFNALQLAGHRPDGSGLKIKSIKMFD